MAKIYGVQVKSVKLWEAREGSGCSANIYINNKKVGTYYNDGNGGAADIDMLTPEYGTMLKEIADKYFKNYPVDTTGLDKEALGGKTFEEKYHYFVDTEALLDILLTMYEHERTFKKHNKEGYTHLVVFDYPLFVKGPHPYFTPMVFGGANVEKYIEKCVDEKKAKYPFLKHKVYSSLQDFIIED